MASMIYDDPPTSVYAGPVTDRSETRMRLQIGDDIHMTCEQAEELAICILDWAKNELKRVRGEG